MLNAPADISRGRDVLVQPDVFVVVAEEARGLAWTGLRTLLLVAEVLSPSTSRGDLILKRLRYREAGVPVYWLIDGDGRTVEVWTPADEFPNVERRQLIMHPAGARGGLHLETGGVVPADLGAPFSNFVPPSLLATSLTSCPSRPCSSRARPVRTHRGHAQLVTLLPPAASLHPRPPHPLHRIQYRIRLLKAEIGAHHHRELLRRHPGPLAI